MADNSAPRVHSKALIERRSKPSLSAAFSGLVCDGLLEGGREKEGEEEIDSVEVFEWIRGIRDPEHPLSLEELRVVSLSQTRVDLKSRIVSVEFTPTVPHCSQATIIGLTIKAVLIWLLPADMKPHVFVTPKAHASATAIDKQLADKERVSAAMENANVLALIMRGAARTRSVDDVIASAVTVS